MRILIIKSSALGDIIQAFPALDYLCQRFPGAEVDWLVEEPYADLLRAHPQVKRVIPISTQRWRKNVFNRATWKEIFTIRKELRAQNYDLIFDLQGNTKSAFFTLWARGRNKIGFGWKSVAEKPNLLVTSRHIDPDPRLQIQERYLKIVSQDSETFAPRPVLLKLSPAEENRLSELLPPRRPCYMVAMGSKWENKQLSYPTLKELLQKIAERENPYFLLIWSNAQEQKFAAELEQQFKGSSRAVGKLSIPLWQALMREVDLVLAVDSAALHLCGTTTTPSFSLFGPSNPAIYKPLGPQHHHIRGKCPYGRVFIDRCPVLRTCPTGACIRGLPVEEIMAAKNGNQAKTES